MTRLPSLRKLRLMVDIDLCVDLPRSEDIEHGGRSSCGPQLQQDSMQAHEILLREAIPEGYSSTPCMYLEAEGLACRAHSGLRETLRDSGLLTAV